MRRRTVHLEGRCVPASCPSELSRQPVTKIEGLCSGDLCPVQYAWIETDVVQGGYC